MDDCGVIDIEGPASGVYPGGLRVWCAACETEIISGPDAPSIFRTTSKMSKRSNETASLTLTELDFLH